MTYTQSDIIGVKTDDEPPGLAKQSKFVSKKEILRISGLSEEEFERICGKYPVRIPFDYFSLIKEKGDGIYRQCIPSSEEMLDAFGDEDPLNEEPEHQERKNVPSLITHRYPDRALFRVSNSCAMYCRFCTRKRKVGDMDKNPTWREVAKALIYLKEHEEIRDVILSGGDPLMLNNEQLEKILSAVYSIISQRENGIIRIGTRVPCVLPSRITPELCDMLKKYSPVYVNTHFNHPSELTEKSEEACLRLVNSGIPVGNQTVLLTGVNDDVETMKLLMQKLVHAKVKPYYIYQCDPVKGANHFRTKVEKGLEIIKGIRGHTSGMCVPHFVIDAPGGGGKIPLLPEYVESITDEKVVMKNYLGKEFEYIQAE